MKFTESFVLPMPPREAAAMYADPSYAQIRGSVLGAVDASSRGEGTPEQDFTVVTDLTMPTDRVPEIARKLVGSSARVRETQTWSAPAGDGERSGTMLLEIPSTPVSMRATTRMLADGEGTRITVDGDLSAKIPLIGGKLEKAALPYISKVLSAEERAARTYRDRADQA